nr:hypothetical protein [uncultured Brevundimonas sp.]
MTDPVDDVRLCNADHMARHPQNNWGTVRYDARFDHYWLVAGDAKQQLFFCPWCGDALPESQRDRWFDALEAEGIDPNRDPIPLPYRTGAWRGIVDPPPVEKQWGAIEGRYIDLFEHDEDEYRDPEGVNVGD